MDYFGKKPERMEKIKISNCNGCEFYKDTDPDGYGGGTFCLYSSKKTHSELMNEGCDNYKLSRFYISSNLIIIIAILGLIISGLILSINNVVSFHSGEQRLVQRNRR